jgi:hypothetical protein
VLGRPWSPLEDEIFARNGGGGCGGGALCGLNRSGERKGRERRASPGTAKSERGGPARHGAWGSRRSATSHIWWRREVGGRARCTPEHGSGTVDTLKTGYPRLQALNQVKEQGVHDVAMLLLLQVIVPTMTLRLHSLRLEVAVVQQQLHLLRAPMRVHSHRRVRASTAAQPRWNE